MAVNLLKKRYLTLMASLLLVGQAQAIVPFQTLAQFLRLQLEC